MKNVSPSPPHPSRRSLQRLDWFIFLVADVQTGFGPFVSVYLTTQQWTQVEIGLVLSVSAVVSLVGQMPGGALVDAVRSVRSVAGVAVSLIAASALVYATWPIFPAVLAASTLHAAASCVLGPAIAAISLGLVGYAAIGERFGRNARFASIGTGLSAAVMGGFGYLFSAQAVFFVTAALLIPALLVLHGIASAEIDPGRAHGNMSEQRSTSRPRATGRARVFEASSAGGRCRCSAVPSCCSTWPTPPCSRSWRACSPCAWANGPRS